MINIIKKDLTTKTCDPHYVLTYNYMIGDADGYTKEECHISLNNPFLERYVTLLNKLKPTGGHWGIMLEEDRLKKHFREGQITKDDYQFLCTLMFESGDNTNVSEEDKDYSYEFYDGVRSDAEYSFLVFEGVTLQYVDEYGVKHDTEIV